MYCPKCKHTSFDHLATCPKCGSDWQSIRTALNLNWLQSPGYEWLPEAALETPPEVGEQTMPTEAKKSGESTLPAEPVHFEAAEEAEEIFTFETQGPDTPGFVPATDLEIEPTTLLAQIKTEVELEVSSDANTPLSSAEPFIDTDAQGVPRETLDASPLRSDIHTVDAAVEEPALVASIPADAHDADPPNQHEQGGLTVPSFSHGSEPADDGLPVWEIEIPRDLLPQEYFPEPVETDHRPKGAHDDPEPEVIEVHGDIAYDFSEVEVVLPEPDEEARPSGSRGTASREHGAPDGDDVRRSTAPLSSPSSSTDSREGR